MTRELDCRLTHPDSRLELSSVSPPAFTIKLSSNTPRQQVGILISLSASIHCHLTHPDGRLELYTVVRSSVVTSTIT